MSERQRGYDALASRGYASHGDTKIENFRGDMRFAHGNWQLMLYVDKMWNYKNLEVWKRAHQLMKDVYGVIDGFPEKEKFNLVSQLRRAVFSVPNNIVEGSGKDTNKDFAHYLDNAIGSLKEVEYQIFASWELDYIGEEKYKELKKEMTILGMKLRAYRRYIGGGKKKDEK